MKLLISSQPFKDPTLVNTKGDIFDDIPPSIGGFWDTASTQNLAVQMPSSMRRLVNVEREIISVVRFVSSKIN